MGPTEKLNPSENLNFVQKPKNPTKKRPDAWTSLFESKDVQTSSKLKFFNQTEATGHSGLDFEDEELEDNDKKWQNSVVGYLLGRRPYFVALKEHLNRIWKVKGSFQMYNLHNGFFLFHFNSSEDCEKILDGGNYSFGGRPLVLRRWSPEMALEKLSLSTIPIWIRFPGLNLRFWFAHCLSKLASKIGFPLYMDSHTTEAIRLSYARVCIEVEAGSSLPDQIEIKTSLGTTYQRVEYEWRPPSCKECNTFNHFDSSCPKNKPPLTRKVQKKEWKPKPPSPVANEDEESIKSAQPPESHQHSPPSPHQQVHLNPSSPPESHQQTPSISQLQIPLDSSNSPVSENFYSEYGEDQRKAKSRKRNVDSWQSNSLIEPSSGFPVNEINHNSLEISNPYSILEALEAWNIRGTGSRTKRGYIKKLIHDHSLPLFCLLETKVFHPMMENCIRDISDTWNYHANYNHTSRGRIWIIWDPQIAQVNIIADSTQFIHAEPTSGNGKKPFKFLNAWLDDVSLVEVVERAWSTPISGNPMYRLALDVAQSNLKSNPADPGLRVEVNQAQSAYASVAKMEESLQRQKSRVQWLNLGDSNSKFFHSALKARRNQNSIHGLCGPSRDVTTDQNQISAMLVSHFHSLLNQHPPNSTPIASVPFPLRKISSEEAFLLSKPFTQEDIKSVIFSQNGNKVPGPDGFN
ncbi:uncharacterized protein LOC143850014 [Tasmannia lanceolata]|uniref:uncharacterized protein LOC143850014 n=1 Tax=Tasmannia lanceolata TaxID=3420 RepID=UPI004063063C